MTNSFDTAPSVRLIANACRTKTRLGELPPGMRPATLDEGYDIQDALIAELADPVVGWKLGQGSPKGLRTAGLERALVGRVLASRRHPAGSSIALPVADPRKRVEHLVALRIVRHVMASVGGSRFREVKNRRIGRELPDQDASGLGNECVPPSPNRPSDARRPDASTTQAS